MKYRRRQRWWLRRIALGLALATVLVGGWGAPASAGFDERGGIASRGVVTPSAGIPGGNTTPEPFVPGVTDFPRPAVVQQPELADEGSAIEWGDGLPLVGSLALAFALGVWLGVRRPRTAAP